MSDEKEEIVGRGRAVTQGTQILKYIEDEHLNRYAFVKVCQGRSWHKRFLELDPNKKQLSWWHNRTSCDKKPIGTIALSSIKDIVFKPSAKTTKILEEITKCEKKINDVQTQMMLIRKKSDIEEQIETEKFVNKVIKAHPELLRGGLSDEKKKSFEKQMQRKYGKWQSKRRENDQGQDVNFQLAATSYIDFRRNFYERLKKRNKSQGVLIRLQRTVAKVTDKINDQERNLEDYRRILDSSRKQSSKAKRNLSHKAKKSDLVLTLILSGDKKGKKEKFRFKNPREASHWRDYINADKTYSKPDFIPQHYDNYEPEDLLVENGVEELKVSDGDSDEDLSIGRKDSAPPSYVGAEGMSPDNEIVVAKKLKPEDDPVGDESGSSDEEG